ncbi:hypothetical protein GCM10018771_66820 [Streptomyces cellulosae]|nr:hypothetical protein GCM10018771_66820 [Streptomyces cellulosae]
MDVRSRKVYPHRRADARRQCSESGKPRYRPEAPTEQLHELNPPVITRRPPRPVGTILEVPVPGLSWVPSLDDVDAPVITLPAHGRLGYWVPSPWRATTAVADGCPDGASPLRRSAWSADANGAGPC